MYALCYMSTLERSLLWAIRGGFVLLLLTPFVVSKSLFFPFITGKNFYFRIITELTVGAWLALACLNPDFRPRKSPLLLAFLAFVSVLVLATIFGADPYHSFWSNFERMEGLVTHLHVFALFLALAHSVREPKEWAAFLVISLGVSFAQTIHGFLQSTGVLTIVGGGRVFAGFGNSIYLSVYLMFHFFFAAIVFLRSKVGWIQGLSVLVFGLELYVFFQSASRGAFVGSIVGVALAAILFLIFAKSRVYKIAGLAGISLVAILAALILFASQSALIQKSELLSRLSGVSLDSVSNDPRIMIWGMALDAAKAHPILGWGPENFVIPYAQFYNPNLFGNEAWFDRAHNMFLEWLVGTGILGLAAYLSIFASAGWLIYKLMHRGLLSQPEAIVLVSLFVAYMAQNFFVFDNIVTYIVLASLFAFLHSSYVFGGTTNTARHKKDQPLALIGAALAVVASLVIVYMVNAPPLFAARQIIVAMESLHGGGGVDGVIQEFDRAINPKSLGTTEARERVADTVVQVAVSVGQTNADFAKLLDYGIQEMEKEFDSSPSPRIPLFLGKLYTIRANLGGQGDIERAEKTYQELQRRAPNYVQVYLGFAELYLITSQPQKAVEASELAFSLPTKKETLGALYFPIFSVYVLSGELDKAIAFTRSHQDITGRKVFDPLSTYDDIRLTVQRARGTKNIASRIKFYEELNNMIFETYNYPSPVLLTALMDLYREAGNESRARELVAKYATEEIKEHARKAAREYTNPRTEPTVKSFLETLEAIK